MFFWCLKDDMEGSGGGFSNGLPGVTGPEGRQVSTDIPVCWSDTISRFKSLPSYLFFLNILQCASFLERYT